jgi:hypothetical protein
VSEPRPQPGEPWLGTAGGRLVRRRDALAAVLDLGGDTFWGAEHGGLLALVLFC